MTSQIPRAIQPDTNLFQGIGVPVLDLHSSGLILSERLPLRRTRSDQPTLASLLVSDRARAMRRERWLTTRRTVRSATISRLIHAAGGAASCGRGVLVVGTD